jgi:hypothetical protein
MDGDWRPIEVYSASLRIRGYIEVLPGQRLTDEVNRLQDYLELHNTLTDPLLASYPVVSTKEAQTSVAKKSVVMIVPADPVGERPADSANPVLRRPKEQHRVVINTTAFSLAAEVHLDPNLRLLDHLLRNGDQFLPVTRVGAVMLASLGTTPQTMQHAFALVNPAAIVSFSDRRVDGDMEVGS